jgi:alpha-tubulin suppressor-like RCC1 family protein
MTSAKPARIAIGTCVLLSVIGCRDAVAPPRTASVSAISATTQEAVAGNAVSQAPTVIVRDSRGQPAAGVVVTFVDTSAVAPLRATTGADGIASTPWFVGHHTGLDRLTVLVEGIEGSVTFIANVRAGPPNNIAIISPFEQIGKAGTAVSSPPKVRVLDVYGNPVPSVAVAFAVGGAAGATIANATAGTDPNGIAAPGDWTLGTAFGQYRLTATIPGTTVPPAVFRALINKPFPVSLISAGGAASCALTTSGLFCWGESLVAPYSATAATPYPVGNAPAFVSLTVGNGHACGLTSAGAAYCWGNNDSGQLGLGTLSGMQGEPGPVAGGLVFTILSAGDYFTCGLTTDQRIFCWGNNTFGQIGDGGTITRLAPVAVSTTSHFTTLAAGFRHVCALATTGTTFCWGENDTGQLGVTSTETCKAPTYDYYGDPIVADFKCSTTPLPNTNGSFTSLAASNGTCGLIAGAQVPFCWGFPAGQVASDLTFVTLAAAENAVCGITTNKSVICWSYGYDYYRSVPLFVDVPSPTRLVAGHDHWCAISGTDGSPFCWGGNSYGQLGNGTSTTSTIALPVAAP